MTSLFARLSLVFGTVLLCLGLLTLWTSHRTTQAYFLEFTQRLNSPVAMYMADNANLVTNGQPDAESLAFLAHHAMMINPSVEVYLLDLTGKVVAHSLAPAELALERISLEPIEQFLAQDGNFPIFGDNPKDREQQYIFSAFPLVDRASDNSALPTSELSVNAENEKRVGYVYVVLAGEKHQSLLAAVADSYSLKTLWSVMAGVLLLALLSGSILFFMLTQRLRRLTQRVRVSQSELTPATTMPTYVADQQGDEIDALSQAYDSMTRQLFDQYKQLEQNDRNRREFFANVSHDLRTPLTTLQSYLETLQLKENTLSEVERRKYVEVAHRQTTKLRQLVMQLFELSKLNSGELTPQSETFSLLEFAHDSCQDFQIKADEKGVSLSVDPESDQRRVLDVHADIAMVHRVFENLIGNALRHTPEGGNITIRLYRENIGSVTIAVEDTGEGLSESDRHRVFERYYPACESSSSKRKPPAKNQRRPRVLPDLILDIDGPDNGGGAGLGLSIVRSILLLHGSEIAINSKPGEGTRIVFTLPASDLQAPGVEMVRPKKRGQYTY